MDSEATPKEVEATPKEVVAKKPVIRDLQATKEHPTIANTRWFYFEYFSEEEGKTYSGNFVCKLRTLGDKVKQGVLLSSKTQGQWLGGDIGLIAQQLTYLAVALTEFPDWWKPEDFYDGDLLRSVFEEVAKWESSFRKSGLAK